MKFGETCSFYIYAVFLVSYATKELGYSRGITLLAIAAGAFVSALMIPVCGLLSDRYRRRNMFVIGSAAMILFAGPYFWLLSQHSTLCLSISTILGIGVIWPFITATLSTMLAELFPAEVRYSGITFGYQIGAALVGGTAPLIATLLLALGHEHWHWISVFIAFSCAISLAAALKAPSANYVQPALNGIVNLKKALINEASPRVAESGE